MAFTNLQVEWTDLIRFSSDGIVVADYVHIRSALIAKYKQIYGEDIDVSTTTADGIWLETISLIINNTLQLIKTMYASLDIRTANGNWLDMLTSLSNVSRKAASSSSAYIGLKLTEGTDWTPTEDIELFDRAGKTWVHKYTGNEPTLHSTDTSPTIFLFECTELGPVSAPGGTAAGQYLDGWICGTVNTTPLLEVYQEKAAALGEYDETDSELRARQHNSGNALGYTTVESLVGALYAISGIEDVKLYNNGGNLGETASAKDGNTVASHSLYVILRRQSNIIIDDKTIGTVLLNKLTPGIGTNAVETGTEQEPVERYGVGHSFTYTQSIFGEDIPLLRQTVHWKEATPIHPAIVLTLTPGDYFASYADSTANTIAQNIIAFANGLQLSENLQLDDVRETARYSDPMFRGKVTYFIDSITIDDEDEDFTNPDTYFDYSSVTVDSTSTPGKVIITIE